MNTGKEIIVLGDVMLDSYLRGNASRLSPEAPVPVIAIQDPIEYRLGGAANVAANVAAMGCAPSLHGVMGFADEGAFHLSTEFNRHNIRYAGVARSLNHITTHKQRIVANGYQIARLDRELCRPLDSSAENFLKETLIKRAPSAFAIIVSDYAKGVITPNLMELVFQLAVEHRLPLFVDPKPGNGRNKIFSAGGSSLSFKEIYMLTPNVHEAELLADMHIDSDQKLIQAGRHIMSWSGATHVTITRGAQGLVIITPTTTHFIQARAQAVFDVSGAGDTFIAAFAASYVDRFILRAAAERANIAAGIAVGKLGTAIVTKQEIDNEFRSNITSKDEPRSESLVGS